MKKILAIDDKIDNLVTLTALLKNMLPHCMVITAQSGLEGLAKAKAERPDVILLDVKMPVMDGFETCRHIMAEESTGRIPVIMITAIQKDKESRIEGLNCGANAFLTKPIDQYELASHVKAALRIKEAEDQLQEQNASLERIVLERTVSLRESEERHRTILQTALDGFWLADRQGRLLDVNAAYCRMSGYSRQELLTMSISDLEGAETMDDTSAHLGKIVEQGQDRFESRHRRKDGRFFDVEVCAQRLPIEDGRLVGFLHDITERKSADYNLRVALEKYRSLAAYVDSIYLVDRDCTYLFMNSRHLKRFGLSLDEVVGKRYGEFHTVEDAREFAKDVIEVCDTCQEITKEHVSNRDGRYFLRTFTPIISPSQNGVISQVAVIAKDITEIRVGEIKLRETLASLRRAVETTINVMVAAVESRDPYTAGHQHRSAHLAVAIAAEMGLSSDKIDGLRTAGSIHDIGKLSIPAEILSKPSKLSDIELMLIREHARKGYEILKDVESPWPLAQIVYQHHERMNGSGYPRGLKGEEILMEARILSIADVVEAMASHRPYRPSLGIDTALDEIEKNKVGYYDDAVVDACLRLFREKGFKLASA